MYLLLTPDYPDESNINMFAFIHSRVRVYERYGLSVQVFVVKSNIEYMEYNFEGINVICGGSEDLVKFINTNDISKILIHFINKNIIDVINRIDKSLPLYIWFHGVEALSWKRRLFYISILDILSIPRFIKYIYNNTRQLNYLSKFINKENDRIHAIAVSDWMKNVVQTDLKCENMNWSIIPNTIDNNIFSYIKKDAGQRKKILLVRSFESKKYANDISIKFIRELSKKEYFNDLEILIIGKGRFFEKLTKKISSFENVIIRDVFLNHYELADIYKQYGVFLCPTRQDSQGVSMCEAMSSGLIPLTTFNTAIPEFVDVGSGFMCNSIDEMVECYDEIYKNEKLFIEMSKNASNAILKKCSYNKTIGREIELIKS